MSTPENANIASEGLTHLDQAPQTFQHQNNSGTISGNQNRTKESHPNCRGRALVDGKWYWVSGWNKVNNSDNGRFVSLAFTLMTQEDVDKYINKTTPASNPAPTSSDGGNGIPEDDSKDPDQPF